MQRRLPEPNFGQESQKMMKKYQSLPRSESPNNKSTQKKTGHANHCNIMNWKGGMEGAAFRDGTCHRLYGVAPKLYQAPLKFGKIIRNKFYHPHFHLSQNFSLTKKTYLPLYKQHIITWKILKAINSSKPRKWNIPVSHYGDSMVAGFFGKKIQWRENDCNDTFKKKAPEFH